MSSEAAEEIYAVLAAVIAATPTVSARPKLLVRFDEDDPGPNREIKRQPGDTPLHILDYAGTDDSGYTADEHYHAGDAPQTWVETGTLNYRLTILGQPGDERLSAVLPYWRAVRSGIRALGDRMGLEYVERVGPYSYTTRVAEASEPIARGSKRRVLEATIPVATNADGKDLED